MLAMNTYPQQYIDDSRAKIDAQAAAYRSFVDAARTQAKDPGAIDAALAEFEPAFFNNLVLAMDNFFTHRTRAIELKDGNPLNEVRVLCQSLTQNGGRMGVDKTIKMKPEATVLGLQVDDEIAIREADFARLSDAFFAELRTKFGATEAA